MKLFLDLDNTVTESRGAISDEMFKELSGFFHDVVIVSGASKEQMEKQLCGLPCILLAQNGNDTPYWKNTLTLAQRMVINYHITQYASIGEDHVEDRGCQISYSFTGHHAPIEVKKAFDPDGSIRRGVLLENPRPARIDIKVGGTTCLDYFPLGRDKGANIKRFINKLGWSVGECLYIGDALFPGGNDESVQGVIPTFQVKNHLETLAFLETL